MQAQAQRIAAAYIRVSTDDQTDLSPESQLEKIREYATKNNLILLSEYIFRDDGISGRAAEKRPGFQQMIATAKDASHPFDVIIVWKYSRFARNQEESIFYKSVLRTKCNVDVVSVSEPLIAGPFGSLIERIIEWMDEFYSVRLSEEVKRSMTVNAQKGRLQASPSFGYCERDHTLAVVPHEAEIVQEIFQRFVAGDAMYGIAVSVNERGVRTHRGNPFENRTIDYILNNPVYIGKLRWTPAGKTRRNFKNSDSIIADAGHPAIIDMQTWEAAQARIAELKRTHKRYGKPSSERKHWLCGIVRCPTCGKTLAFSAPHYMQCSGRLKASCSTSQHIAIELLEEAFLQQLQHDMTFSDSLSYTVTFQMEAHATASLAQKRAKIASRMARLRDAYLDGVESLDDYKAARQKLQNQLSEIDNDIKKAAETPESVSAESIREAIASVLRTLRAPESTISQKYESAQAIIDKCYFDKSKMLLTISYNFTV